LSEDFSNGIKSSYVKVSLHVLFPKVLSPYILFDVAAVTLSNYLLNLSLNFFTLKVGNNIYFLE
jgi:hypothetical protein